LLRTNSHFSPDVPEPRALATAIHLGLALTQINNGTWGGHMQNDKAMAHLRAALTLSPDSDLANYYYGYGWGRLSPAERAKIGSEQQAKAALRKAVKLGKGGVKKAAQKALLVAMKTK
jgi:tetratricopeptide (TPR) repeat protein